MKGQTYQRFFFFEHIAFQPIEFAVSLVLKEGKILFLVLKAGLVGVDIVEVLAMSKVFADFRLDFPLNIFIPAWVGIKIQGYKSRV